MGNSNGVNQIVETLSKDGADVYYVGGCVRDMSLGISPKDIDVEVYGIKESVLESLLSGFGDVQKVGKSFGVWKFTPNGKHVGVDVAMPRREVKAGVGHTGFRVELDPYMDLRDAASRRDYTVNALMINAGGSGSETIDFFGGIADLEDRVLRHVSDIHFAEDPLRPLRAMQFAGRFGMTLAGDTAGLCRAMFEDGMHGDLPVERVWGEFEKWAVQSAVPSLGLRALVDMGWIGMFPELEALIGLEQSPRFHPEGDAFEHTLCVVDEMAVMLLAGNVEREDRVVLMLAALCHDLGKATTTTVDIDGKISSSKHAKAGRSLARRFLERIGAPNEVVLRVIPLVAEHMIRWKDEPTDRTIRRLAKRLVPATIRQLQMVIRADFRGRPPLKPRDPFEQIADIAERLDLMDDGPVPILMGRHLLERDIKPGPLMGKILRVAFERQLDGAFEDLEGALSWFDDAKVAFDFSS